MPNPSQTRELRILRLVTLAKDLIDVGVAYHLLFGKLWALAQRSWPTVRESTRRDYVVSAIKAVRTYTPTTPDIPVEVELSQEEALQR